MRSRRATLDPSPLREPQGRPGLSSLRHRVFHYTGPVVLISDQVTESERGAGDQGSPNPWGTAATCVWGGTGSQAVSVSGDPVWD